MEVKFNTLDDIAKTYELSYENEDIEYATEILKIYNSENPENLDIDLENLIILNWLGLYYDVVNVNTELMYKYYHLGISKKSLGCIICMSIYHQKNKNYVYKSEVVQIFKPTSENFNNNTDIILYENNKYKYIIAILVILCGLILYNLLKK